MALVALLLGTGLALLTAEGALRLLHRWRPLPLLPQASYDRFRARPGSRVYGFPISSRGFLDREVASTKPAGTFRILGIGDSFAYGVVPYRANYLTLLEERLSRRRPTEVVNMGIPNLGPEQYLALLVAEGLPLDPDAVLLTFFVGNDLTDPSPSRLHGSYLLAAVDAVWRALGAVERPVYTLGRRYRDDQPTLTAEAYRAILAPKLELYRADGSGVDHRLAPALAPVERMAALCRRRAVRLLVLLAPDELEVDPAVRADALLARPDLASVPLDPDLPRRRIADALAARGVATFDLTPALRAAADQGPVYRPRDSHWNVRGNRVAAEAAVAAVTAAGWLYSR